MLATFLLIAYLIATSVAQATTENGNCTTVEECIPMLANNDQYMPSKRTRLIGGQNFTWCCTKAVADSLFIDADGMLAVKNDPPAIHLNATLLKKVTDLGLFPCSADYNSEYPSGSPEINVNYTWLAATCPGWQLNRSQDLNVLQTISGFLLPAVIFCLSVPRRRKFHVLRSFFVADLAGIKSYVPALFGAVGAMAIVTLDTALWLSVCFALAGPMILSGLYEALLDSRVIDFVREKTVNGRLTLDMSCRLLMVVLIGNLDLAIDDDPLVNQPGEFFTISGIRENRSPSSAAADHHKSISDGEEAPTPPGRRSPDPHSNSIALMRLNDVGDNVGEIRQVSVPDFTNELGIKTDDGTRSGPSSGASEQRLSSPRVPQIRIEGASVDPWVLQRRDTSHLKASPWRHMEELLYPIRLYDDERSNRQLSPRQYPLLTHRHSSDCSSGVPCNNRDHVVQEKPYPRNAKIERQISKTQTRLRTMLNCQYSFGSMVGAPVLFFLGGFVFALLQSLQDLGDEDTALALAFGQWYMTIPHIAIISGLLLAGNNPNILEGVFATQRQNVEKPKRILGLEFGLAYPSCYKVAWQWQRGPNKKRWIETLISTYSEPSGTKDCQSGYYEINQEDMKILREKTTPSPLDWIILLSMCSLLLGVPFILAFLTAFYTPEIGVSCRSFTFLIYTSAEFGQILLWLWAVSVSRKATLVVTLLKDDLTGNPYLQLSSSRNAELTDSQYAVPPGLIIPSTRKRSGWLDRHGFYNLRSVKVFLQSDKARTMKRVGRLLTSREFFSDVRSLCWFFLYIFLGIIAALAAIGGTLMQILGVYSADICYLTADQWVHPSKPGNTALISKNSRSMILDAQEFWKPCAITAIAFMSFVSFVGWWYQRRTRDVFMGIVSSIEDHSREDTKEAIRTRTESTDKGTGTRNLWGSPPM